MYAVKANITIDAKCYFAIIRDIVSGATRYTSHAFSAGIGI